MKWWLGISMTLLALGCALPREDTQQVAANRIIRRFESFHPLALHLRIAEGTQHFEKMAAGLLEFFPTGAGIHFAQNVRHGPAMAQRHAQIVNRVGFESFPCGIGQIEYATHPHFKPNPFRRSARDQRNW